MGGTPLKHRHLRDGVGFTTAAIDDILDRGTQADWADLFAEVEREPYGRVAADVLRICEWHDMYGTSLLWPAMIERVRAQRRHVR